MKKMKKEKENLANGASDFETSTSSFNLRTL